MHFKKHTLRLSTLVTLMLALLIIANPVHACTYKVDEGQKSAELLAVAVASLSGKEIQFSSIKDFAYVESKSTPMCPEELTYTATVEVGYTEERKGFCTVQLQVQKAEPFGGRHQGVYTIKGTQAITCQ